MPTYAAYTDVTDLTGNPASYTQAELEAFIARAEGEVEGWLYELAVTGDAASAILKTAVLNLSISVMYTRMRIDGTKPSNLTMGDLTQGDNIQEAIDSLRAQARSQVESYALGKKGRPYKSTSGAFDTTIVRQDHKMGSMKLDQAKVPEYHDRADEYASEDDEEVT
jgi:hypothetical protein